MKQGYDVIVVGGGLVGSAVAMGIISKGKSVAVLDGGDRDFRASRGNFGLTWVQGKGANSSSYAKLNGFAAKLWPGFEQELKSNTGIDIGFKQPGGVDFCLSEEEWQDREAEMQAVKRHTNGAFNYQMLEHSELKKRVPEISRHVLGASFSPHDGHLNPLYLLHALHQRMMDLGCVYCPKHKVESIDAGSNGFKLYASGVEFESDQVVLCGGLDNQRLAEHLEMYVPVHPIRGQLLITERVKHFLNYPSIQIRQTEEGTLQIGDSHEDVGLDDSTTIDVITQLAKRAVTIFPHLHNIHVSRAWGALRIMTPDGLPIYHQSEQRPGAFAISCHSGVTLAVIHAGIVANWICGDQPHSLISKFSANRFDVQTT